MSQNWEKFINSVTIGLHFKGHQFEVCKYFYDILDAFARLKDVKLEDISSNVFEIKATINELNLKLSPGALIIGSKICLEKSLAGSFRQNEILPNSIFGNVGTKINCLKTFSSENSFKTSFFEGAQSLIDLVLSRPNFVFPKLKFVGLAQNFCFPQSVGKFKFFSAFNKSDGSFSSGELNFRKRYLLSSPKNGEFYSNELVFSYYEPDVRGDKEPIAYGVTLDMQAHSKQEEGYFLKDIGSLQSFFNQQDLTIQNCCRQYGFLNFSRSKGE